MDSVAWRCIIAYFQISLTIDYDNDAFVKYIFTGVVKIYFTIWSTVVNILQNTLR